MSKSLLINRPFKYRYYYVTIILIALNFLCFIPKVIYPALANYIDAYGGLSVAGCIKYNMWWQPLTYMFIHSGWEHIIFNMLGLLCFGISVERAIGSSEFLLFYFLCGIFDGLVSLGIYFFFGIRVLLVGASGAIYSVLLLYSVLFPRNVLMIWGIIPIPAPLLVLLYAVIAIISQVFGTGNTAHLTHLTGFIMAIVYLLVRMKVNPIRVWKSAYSR